MRQVGDLLYGADAIVSQWVARHLPGHEVGDWQTAIGVRRDSKLVAGVVYEKMNDRCVAVAIAAKPKSRWATRTNLNRLFAYPFEQLQIDRITSFIAASNHRSIAFAMDLGFLPEAMLEAAAFDGSDLLVLKMFRHQCRWLHHGTIRQEQGARST